MDTPEHVSKVFSKYAEKYQERFMNFELYNDTFDKFCSVISKRDPQILELGCGPGNITKYLLSKRPDFKILGIDLSEKMISLAKINNPGAEFKVMDCRDVRSLNAKYDAVMCGFCLPYLSKTEAIRMIADVSGLLNPGGIFYISTMEDDNSKSSFKPSSTGEEEMFMNYHEEGYLTDALEVNGFSIVDLQRKDFTNHDGSKAVDLILIALKEI